MVESERTQGRSSVSVLIVEDDQAMSEMIRAELVGLGWQATIVHDGAEACRSARDHQPDIVLLDVQLPGIDGLEVCRRLRRDPATSQLPVIIVSARTHEVDRVVGLELGADDYVSKPFSIRELTARIRAVLRRHRAQVDTHRVVVGPLELDPVLRRASLAGAIIDLRVREFDLLLQLALHPGRVWSRERLLADVWGYGDPTDLVTRTVDVHIRRIRMKLGPFGEHIETLRGAGYRLNAPRESPVE